MKKNRRKEGDNGRKEKGTKRGRKGETGESKIGKQDKASEKK